MCEVIHVTQNNQSIWICESEEECPRKRSVVSPSFLANFSNLTSTNFSNLTSTNFSNLTSTNNSSANVKRASRKHNNGTNTSNIANNTMNNKTEGEVFSPSPSSTLAVTLDPPIKRVTIYLRPLRSNNSNTSNTTTTNKCICDTSQLLWLHSLWVLPLCFCILLVIYQFSKKKRHKISNIFIPQKSKTITRSLSWPQLSPNEPVLIVPASEPGDVSSRGVFLTGIL